MLDLSESSVLMKDLLPAYLARCRWFAGKARRVRRVCFINQVPMGQSGAVIALIEAQFTSGRPERYILPLVAVKDERELDPSPSAVIGRVTTAQGKCWLADAVYFKPFREHLYSLLTGSTAKTSSSVLPREQSNTTMVFARKAVIKLFRRVTPGINPDVELTRYLTCERGFSYVPKFLGELTLAGFARAPVTVGAAYAYVAHRFDGWALMLGRAQRYLFLAQKALKNKKLTKVPKSDILLARRLAQRTASMHLALAHQSDEAEFSPVRATPQMVNEMLSSMRRRARRALISAGESALVRPVLKAMRPPFGCPAMKLTRLHGDYHLGQALWTGKEWMIIDFEGEPLRSLAERREKGLCLRDAAGMLRSFHYCICAVLMREKAGARAGLKPVVEVWYQAISEAFWKEYCLCLKQKGLLAGNEESVRIWLKVFLLEKAAYELSYEIKHRPAWAEIPRQGLVDLLKERE